MKRLARGLLLAMVLAGCGDICEDACENALELGCITGDPRSCGDFCEVDELEGRANVRVYECQAAAATCEAYTNCRGAPDTSSSDPPPPPPDFNDEM
ncbi:MAG: hypothetical protein AAGA56_06395 [Myxococcota bacterium]